MKKIFTLMFAALTMTAAQAQDIKTLDFEDEGWATLIDNPQYNGPLIYSADAYNWGDMITDLYSECIKADWTQWNMGYGWDHGIAISNYVDADENASYDKQLSVPVSNGSKNFAVVWDNNSELKFLSGTPHVIKSIDVCPTTYSLNNVKKNCGEGYKFTVTLTGMKADSTTTTLDIPMADGTNVISDWTTVNTEALGEIVSLIFTFSGTDTSDYGGINTPKYLAIDNITVDMASAGIEAAQASADAKAVAYYTTDGKKLSAAKKGINIVRMSDGTTRKINVR